MMTTDKRFIIFLGSKDAYPGDRTGQRLFFLLSLK